MKSWFFLFLSLQLAAVALVRAQEITDKDFTMYQNSKFPFSVAYPKSWSAVPASHPQTRLKVVSKAGAGEDDFSVVVEYHDDLRQTSPARFADSLLNRPEDYLDNIKEAAPRAKLLRHGPTYLSNHEACFFEVDFVARVLDLELPTTMYQLLTAREGNVYTLTFRTSRTRYDDMKPVFDLIAAQFVIRPTALSSRSSDVQDGRERDDSPRRRSRVLPAVVLVGLAVSLYWMFRFIRGFKEGVNEAQENRS